MMGEESTNWKGGRKTTCFGYVLIYRPDHPFCNCDGYVLEHRLVMEKKLERYLKPEEIVHHINGIKDDNRIKNLKLFANSGKHLNSHFKGIPRLFFSYSYLLK